MKELVDRNQAIDEINREVDRLFKENGIEIAFRQLDINLRDSKGLEKLVHRSRIEDSETSENLVQAPQKSKDQDPTTPNDVSSDAEPGGGSPPL